ncbi:hypothetical protein HU200_049193 [Digitaria exilis]|uniref:Uncharacterized protein n=1 Tax=Digitaria exilis TaxID=1010633 RepID=A0A835AWK0_9POAL|nr:hypothetical protein HU200_049193 [Digitaria exilis]
MHRWRYQAINGVAVVVIMALAVAGRPTAVYVFGDSILDVGNNNHLPGAGVPRADHPYYGVDFPGGARPTGRWSNGYNLADLVAMAMGFKRSPPAYLRLVVRGLRGVNYASAGAGILDSTFAGTNIPLSKQVRNFGVTRAQMVTNLGATTANDLLSKSLFLIAIGTNDMAAFAATQQQQQQSGDVAAFYSSLISNYSATITELYGMGARKLGVVNVGQIGCAPLERAQSPTGACAAGTNALAAGFDDALRSLLERLVSGDDQQQHCLRGLAYSLGDLYGLMQTTITDPGAAGLSNVDDACCGGGGLSGCLPNSTLCGDRRRYLFWDYGHPTQRGAEIIASAFYDGPARFTTPVNLKQLVSAVAVYTTYNQLATMGCLNNVGLVTLLVVAVASNNAAAEVPAVYVLGDSTVDVGNNNYLPGDFPRADHPYYGVDFPGGGRPTGRWSNGYNLADFVVGFRRSPPAYLSLTGASSKSRRRHIREGLGGNPGKYIPLSQQLRYFGATRAEMVATLGASAATELLSSSLFLISIGTNDIGVFVAAQRQQISSSSPTTRPRPASSPPLTCPASSPTTPPPSLLAIVNVGMIGCAPWARLQSPTGECAAAANELAGGFNAALLRFLVESSSRLRGLGYSVGDLHGLMQATMASPSPAGFGLRNVDSACCGGGRLGAQSGCWPNSTTLCVDRRRYLFWDSSGHPTQRAAQIIASAFYDGQAQFTAPVNFKHLVLRSA